MGTVFRFTWSKQPVELPDMPDAAAAAADAVESPLEKPEEAKSEELSNEEHSDEEHSEAVHSEQEAPEEYLKADQTIIRNSHAELMEEEPSS